MTTEYVAVATTNEVPEDRMIKVQAGYWDICVVNWRGSYYALSTYCPHMGGEIVRQSLLTEPEIHCGMHGYRFDVRSGLATWPEGLDELETYPVQVQGDQITVLMDVPASPWPRNAPRSP